jgi:competence protein ComEC
VEAEGMRELVQSGVELKSQVFKVPHHGSRHSQDTNFLSEVNPQVAIISVGKNNFGHPAAEVVQDFQQRQVPVFRTDQHGAITLECDGRRIKVFAFKQPEAK